jgi:hypothetical protein
MLSEPLLQWLITQVGLAGIAALSLILLKRDCADRVDAELTRRTEEREDKLTLLQAYRENSAVLKEVSDTLATHSDSLNRLAVTIDRLQR